MKTQFLALFPALLLPQFSLSNDQLEHIIVTATQAPSERFDIPLSAAILSEEDLEVVQHTHPNESFQRISGTWISRGNGQESLTALRSPVLTGAGSCGAFFIAGDGISLRAPGFCNVNQLFDANTEQAVKIEVLKGPATALYGSGAMHGLINVLSPSPTEKTQLSIGLEAGPHNYRRGKLLAGGSTGPHALILSANYTDDKGYKRDSGFDQYKGTLRYGYDGADFTIDSILNLTELDQETAGFIQGYKAYGDADRKKENPNPEAYRKSESKRFQSTITMLLDNGNKLTLTPYWREVDMEFLQHFLPWQPVEQNGAESLGLNSKYYHQATWLKWVSGVDLDFTDGWLKEIQNQPFSLNQPAGIHYDYRVDAIVAAAWTQLDWDIARQWNLGAGLRHEYHEYDYDNRSSAGPACEPGAGNCRFYRPANREDAFNNWSFNLGLVYNYRPNHGVFTRISRGFRAPQATELYRLQNGQQSANLDSEQLDSIELGLRGTTDSLQYEVAGYYTGKHEVIFQDANRRNISGADTLHYGLDVSLRWQLSEAVDLALDGTLQRHEYDSAINLLGSGGDIEGNRIDTAPDRFGSARLGWNFPPGYRVELEWLHMDNYYLEPDNRHQYDGHDLYNLRLTARLSDRIHAGLRIHNLSNEDYADRADFGFGSYRYFVGEERALYAHLEYRFIP